MRAATSLDRSLAQRSASTIRRNKDSAGETSSREMARAALDIDSLSATLEAIYSSPWPKGVTSRLRDGEKYLSRAAARQTALIVLLLIKEVGSVPPLTVPLNKVNYNSKGKRLLILFYVLD